MARTKEITINGTTYLLTVNIAAINELAEHGISLRDIDGKADSGPVLKDILLMISVFIRAGARYAKLTGMREYPEIDPETLAVVLWPSDFESIMQAITDVTKGVRNVEAEPPKNAAATRAGRKR